MIYDLIENCNDYYNSPAWNEAFNFLSSFDPATPTGKICISGDDIYANVNEYETINPEGAGIESHQKYTDIQVLISGKEQIFCWPTQSLNIKTPYDAEKDAAFYATGKEQPVKLIMEPGVFAFFLPQDAHSPNLSYKDNMQTVKKVVIKIRKDLVKC